MGNFYEDNEDLKFYVEKWIDWKAIVELTEPRPEEAGDDWWKEYVDTYKDVLRLSGEFAAEEIDPRAARMDDTGMHMADGKVVAPKEHTEIFEKLREMGMYGLITPTELGGMNAPGVVYLLMCELLARADVSVMTHFGFHVTTISTLLSYSMMEGTTKWGADGAIVETRWHDEIQEIMAGDAWGAMDLTEPGAGSDLAALRTRAVKDENDVWRVTGNKIFITSGHGNYHFVLAKTDDKPSLKSLSLFLVPLEIKRNGETIRNAYVDRIEEKIGHHASATCSVQFDNSEGELIGKIGDGFKLMLQLMNHARLGVGVESIGIAEAAYRAAKAYAAERMSMGCSIDQHPMIADYLEELDVGICGLRAMAIYGGVHEEKLQRLETQERIREQRGEATDAEMHRKIRRHRRRVRKITPLLKYAAAEFAVYAARMSMQILGGYGYMHEYAPERLLRDALVLPVYEGTSQIQALMALKDNLGLITRNPQKFLRKLGAAKINVRSGDALERAVHRMESMALSAQQSIIWRVAKDKASDAWAGPLTEFLDRFTKNWDPKRDFAHGQLHAERLTRILADTAIAKLLLKQAKKYPERRELAQKWVERTEPRVRYNLDLLQNTGDHLLDALTDRARKPAANEDTVRSA